MPRTGKESGENFKFKEEEWERDKGSKRTGE